MKARWKSLWTVPAASGASVPVGTGQKAGYIDKTGAFAIPPQYESAGPFSEGLAVLKGGKSKADAAWAIYGLLKDEDKELIVAAFIKGATLTEKGALTYWYNCKRKAKEAPAK